MARTLVCGAAIRLMAALDEDEPTRTVRALDELAAACTVYIDAMCRAALAEGSKS
jgi:hypothetical protein